MRLIVLLAAVSALGACVSETVQPAAVALAVPPPVVHVAKTKVSQSGASVDVTFTVDFHPPGTHAAMGDLLPAPVPNVRAYRSNLTWSLDPVAFSAADLVALKAGHPVTVQVSGQGTPIATPLALTYVFRYAEPPDQNGVRKKYLIRGQVSYRSP